MRNNCDPESRCRTRTDTANPLGQDQTPGARPCLTPCLHIVFQVPFVGLRDTRDFALSPLAIGTCRGARLEGTVLPVDDEFTPRLGRIGNSRRAGGNGFSNELRRAKAKLGGKSGNTRYTGRQLGRGSATARQLEFRQQRLAAFRMRRVIVKFHIARSGKGGGLGAFRAHLHYIQRDGVERDGQGGDLYARDGATPDRSAFLYRSEVDRHQFRIIVSPEDGVALGDLRESTRALMMQMERDLGTRLDWVAVDHHNTGHPHTHIVVRGKDARGQDLVIAPDYLKSGLRQRASDIVTERLGPRRDLEIARSRHAEVRRDRLTAIDRAIWRDVENGTLSFARGASNAAERFDRSLRLQRLAHLRKLGLAEPVGHDRWRLVQDWDRTLAELGRRGDVIRTLAHRFGREDGLERLATFDPRVGQDMTLSGSVLAVLPDDELRDQRSVVVEDFDGRKWLVGLGDIEPGGIPPEGAIVQIGGRKPRARSSDRTIAGMANEAGGFYSEDIHAGADPSSSAAFRQAHVRRLESLRRAGLVKRMPDGTWPIPEDYLEKAAEFEAGRHGNVRLSVRSWLSLEQQTEREGATWLDDLSAGTQTRRLVAARRARLDWLREQGFLPPGEQTLGRDARSLLVRRDRARAVARIAEASGRVEVELHTGETISGRYERPVDLGAGRYAIIGNARHFALVPWRPDIERHRGRDLVARRTAQGVSWTIGIRRQRGRSR